CDHPTYGYVFAWADWIKSTVIHGAELGGYAPPAWAMGYPTDPVYSTPVGMTCTAATECASKQCTDGYCTRPCTAVATCPEGFTCTGDPAVCTKRSAAMNEGMHGGCSVRSGAGDARGSACWWALMLMGIGIAVRISRRR